MSVIRHNDKRYGIRKKTKCVLALVNIWRTRFRIWIDE